MKYKYRPTRSKNWAERRQNRRIIQEYGIEEANRVGALNSIKENRERDKIQKKKTKNNKSKTSLHTGREYHIKYGEFITMGGDPSSCPFD